MRFGYAAGLYEGEGFVAIARKNGRVGFQLKIKMTNRWPLDRMKRWFGGSVSVLAQKNPRWRPLFLWTIVGDAAVRLYEGMKPRLSQRRIDQIEAALSKRHQPARVYTSFCHLPIESSQRGYSAHVRRGTKSCERCSQSKWLYMRDYNASKHAEPR
jgi:hypothetical protein